MKRHPDNPPLSAEAEAYVAKVFKCEPPCDSFGVCSNCCEAIVFGAGYNFGLAAEKARSQRLVEALETIIAPGMDPAGVAFGAMEIARKALTSTGESSDL